MGQDPEDAASEGENQLASGPLTRKFIQTWSGQEC